MPEGDTIARSAARLGSALTGGEVTKIAAPRWAGRLPAVGEQITAVESIGKHLEISFSGGLVLRTHMRMSGSWHIYRPGERWRKARSTMRVHIETPSWQAVCFLAPEVEFRQRRVVGVSGVERRSSATSHLGPDLCREDADLDECVDRFALLEGSRTIAEALLDQRVCCGVGNVFKSEICWAAELDPFTPVGEVPVGTRRQLVDIASTQLRANLNTSRRTTVPGGLAVYGHAGEPCRRCAGPIVMRRHGLHARSTYWCPVCQLPPPGDGAGQPIDQ